MDKKLKAEWVAALRSGKYKQAKGKLLNPKTGGMCCLGVLCHICGVAPKFMANNTDVQGEGLAPLDSLSIQDRYRLAEMNDEGKRFRTIADCIEANL